MATTHRTVWLVTGAAGSLGRSLIRRLTAAGSECIAVDRDEQGLNRLHDDLVAEGLTAPALMPLDLAGAGPEDYQRLDEAIDDCFGRLDGVIHNAAAFGGLRPMLNQPPAEWMDILQTGLTGPWLMSSALLNRLRESPRGVIVFIADPHCLEQPGNWGAYGVAQAGRRQMARALADETGRRGLRVVEIDPGPFYSRLRTTAWPSDSPEDLPSADDAARRVIDRIEADS